MGTGAILQFPGLCRGALFLLRSQRSFYFGSCIKGVGRLIRPEVYLVVPMLRYSFSRLRVGRARVPTEPYSCECYQTVAGKYACSLMRNDAPGMLLLLFMRSLAEMVFMGSQVFAVAVDHCRVLSGLDLDDRCLPI